MSFSITLNGSGLVPAFTPAGALPAFAMAGGNTTETGISSATGVSESEHVGSPHCPHCVGRMGTTELASKYVLAFIDTPTRPQTKRRFLRTDAVAERYNRFTGKYPALCKEVERRAKDPKEMQTALESAKKTSNTYDSGLAIGFLDPEHECNIGSTKFRDGYRMGQVYNLKWDTGSERSHKPTRRTHKPTRRTHSDEKATILKSA